MPNLTSLDHAITEIQHHVGDRLVVAGPLGLGKPHRLLNAIYQAYAGKPGKHLHIVTALSLTPPKAKSDLEKRFLQPFLDRHFGADFPSLDYAIARSKNQLPDNVIIEEFYMQSGALLGCVSAQRHYANLNYTHAARGSAARGVNVTTQLVAREPNGDRYSLSCNPDTTFDLLDALADRGLPRSFMVAEVHPDLPFMDGEAAVSADFFDLIIDLPGPAPKLFALPRQPVADAEYAIGFLASTLVKDGGTLQIGIGALSDALAYALGLRHNNNAQYLQIIKALWPTVESSPLIKEFGDLQPFQQGLYGASEMLMDGFRHLVEHGVIKRRVIDDIETMKRINAGTATASDHQVLERDGKILHGAFFLGSPAFYQWLNQMSPAERGRIEMTRVSRINELYGGAEMLEREQRKHARFFNTCMMMNVLGAATSDALDDGRVVSGVGGQYNFVAMAHALRDARSVLMFRAVRSTDKGDSSNVMWNYGHTTIPRHLRDIALNEYGIADLRDANDETCIQRMLAITDARFAPQLLEQAKGAKKCSAFDLASIQTNTPKVLSERLRPFRQAGMLPDYPLGSDFTESEQRLARALTWLKSATATGTGKLRTIASALTSSVPVDNEALARMQLDSPRNFNEKLLRKLVSLALQQ